MPAIETPVFPSVMEPTLQSIRRATPNLHLGDIYYVKPTGNNGNDGSQDNPFATITKAVTKAAAGDTIVVGPGEYVEAVAIPRAKNNLRLIGAGGIGSVFIAPTAANATALTNEADDVSIWNVGCDGVGTGSGLENRGRRFRAKHCKFEVDGDALTGDAAKITLGTVAQINAGTHGKGDDLWFFKCEFAYASKLVELAATDYGALTQIRFRDCTFHDAGAAHFEESGGSADIRYRDLDLDGCKFRRQQDGTEPTAYMLLNDDNGNKGTVADCTFPTAINSGKNLVSTGLIWTSNKHTGGISTGQPS